MRWRAGVFGAARIWVFSVAFTLAILLFSEVLPKTIGVVYSRALAPFVARPLAWLVALFGPLIALTQLATRVVRSESQEQPHFRRRVAYDGQARSAVRRFPAA